MQQGLGIPCKEGNGIRTQTSEKLQALRLRLDILRGQRQGQGQRLAQVEAVQPQESEQGKWQGVAKGGVEQALGEEVDFENRLLRHDAASYKWSVAEQARWLGAAAGNTTEALRALVAIVSKGDSRLGRFSRRAAFDLDCSTLGTMPESKALLPISAAAAKLSFKHWAEELPLGMRDGIIEGSVGIILVLNFYSCAGFSPKPIPMLAARKLTEAQVVACRHVFAQVGSFLEYKSSGFDLKTEVKQLRERKTSYSGDTVSVRRDLVADLVEPALPKAGELACATSSTTSMIISKMTS